MRRGRLVALVTLALAAGCITKGEYTSQVKARRAYHDATAGDLVNLYETLPEPVRSNRLHAIDDDEQSIRAAEVRAGLRASELAPLATDATTEPPK